MAEPRFRMLGPLEFHDGTAWRGLGAPKWRTLLATLLVNAGQPVATAQLVMELWGDEEPRGARNQLQGYVMRLRRALGDPDGAVLQTKAPGYLLATPADGLDANNFESLVEAGHAALRAGDADTAAAQLAEALALWRGPALADVPPTPGVQAAATRWEELRLAALEAQVDADLARGRDADLVAELQALVREHALRERFWEQLMLALHRCGRRGDALATYRQVYDLLSERLGVEPGARLQQLHHQILRADPVLGGAPPATAAGPPRASSGPSCLPFAVTDFTGRLAEVDRMLTAADGGGVLLWAIDGMAGAGKTALAVHVAHRLAADYPDGQLFVDLHGYTPGHDPVEPGAALSSLLRQLGVPGDQVAAGTEERAARWRTELADRRVVLVLDNAAGAAQVRPLLPGASHAVVLVTSRRRLAGLEGARPLSLSGLPTEEATTLFTRVAGRDNELAAVAEVVQLCGHLPLALRLAAARLAHRPRWRVADLADRLRDQRRGLAELAGEDRSVSASFHVSYEQLTAGQQRLFRLLGLVPGADFDAHLAAALAGLDLREAGTRLEDLVDAHLLEASTSDRYHFHDLVRQYARHACQADEPEPSRRRATGRMLDYYLHTADRAAAQLSPRRRQLTLDISEPPATSPPLETYQQGLQWLETEHRNLVAATEHASALQLRAYAWQLPYRMWHFCYIRGYVAEWLATHRIALAAAEELDDLVAQATTHTSLGIAYRKIGDYPQAIAHTERAIALHRGTGNQPGEASSLNSLGIAHSHLGGYAKAIAYYRQAHELFVALGEPDGEGDALHNLADAYQQLGRISEAIECSQRVLALNHRIGSPNGVAGALSLLAELFSTTGRHTEAIMHARQAYAVAEEHGARAQQGYYLSCLTVTSRRAGRTDDAIRYGEQAVGAFRTVGDLTGEAIAHNDAADTLTTAGRRLDSFAHRRQALALARQISDRHQEARALAGLAEVLRDDDEREARRCRELATRIYQELGVPAEAGVTES